MGSATVIEQGTPEWKALRCGKVTASRVHDAVTKLKNGSYGTGRDTYMAELIVERLTGEPIERYVTTHMQRGTEKEPDAAAFYELLEGVDTTKIAFVDHPTIPMSGASPDRLVGDVGLAEFKCPTSHTQIKYLMAKKVPPEYLTQMQWQMACLPERLWCDFISFDDRVPPHLQFWKKRVPRDDERIAELQEEVAAFLAELDGKIAALMGEDK